MNDKLINTINITQNENEEVYGTITARNATDAAQLDAVSIVK